MTSAPPSRDEAAIGELLGAYHEAMVDARTDLLERLVAADFYLVHITGYRQPKHEWFEVIRNGDFDYHRIDVDERALAIRVTGDAALLSGRGIFHATISGMNSPWRLQFTMQIARRNGAWTVLNARYDSF
jgi:hypothetical protein